MAVDCETALADARTLACNFMPAAKATSVRSFALVTISGDGEVDVSHVVAMLDRDEYVLLAAGGAALRDAARRLAANGPQRGSAQ